MQPHSLCIAIADKLRERILAHLMPPGSDVNDGALAREFGVSRTPVREAMKLLCHEGLLTAHARRGMTVTELSAHQVNEARQLSALLASRLRELEFQAPDSCTELTLSMYRLAQSRLRLSLGPDFADPPLAHQPRPMSAAPDRDSGPGGRPSPAQLEARH
ncbi:GntR family transcriptional regulator [Comamonas guangdongensis]|uniref:GntR family transcriptional regulator n=1 Tax=Comamonas guangdongensis TaxID=510515 RepID=A0ABV3ZS36_9BURK